jgi:hypothetical protein
MNPSQTITVSTIKPTLGQAKTRRETQQRKFIRKSTNSANQPQPEQRPGLY